MLLTLQSRKKIFDRHNSASIHILNHDFVIRPLSRVAIGLEQEPPRPISRNLDPADSGLSDWVGSSSFRNTMTAKRAHSSVLFEWEESLDYEVDDLVFTRLLSGDFLRVLGAAIPESRADRRSES
jgi:hypothetical protein